MAHAGWSRDDRRGGGKSLYARCLGLYIEGGATGEDDEKGAPVRDDDFSSFSSTAITNRTNPVLLSLPPASSWHITIDTRRPHMTSNNDGQIRGTEKSPLESRSLVLCSYARPSRYPRKAIPEIRQLSPPAAGDSLATVAWLIRRHKGGSLRAG
jgi:hypothetical protein